MLSAVQLTEYSAVRQHAGVWLRNDAALIRVSGADRYTWLQGMISNDITMLTSKSATRLLACILNATGHLLSTITLTTPPDFPDSLLIEAPATEREKLLDTLDKYLITEDVELTTVDLATVTLQGPDAGAIAADICDHRIVPYYAADHTGSNGFDSYVSPGFVVEFMSESVARGAVTIGPATAELLRIEAGVPKYGVDMDSSVIALEAGLGPTHISLTKGCYVGQEIIARIDSRGHTNRALTGLVFPIGASPIPGDTITPTPTDEEPSSRETGRITSVAPVSPTMGGRPIALGYVRHEHRTPGTALIVGKGGSVAEVVELPFWRGLP
jgi:folate-binding protein YgfZ